MRSCTCCGLHCESGVTCPFCGEASWQDSDPAEPKVADEPTLFSDEPTEPKAEPEAPEPKKRKRRR